MKNLNYIVTTSITEKPVPLTWSVFSSMKMQKNVSMVSHVNEETQEEKPQLVLYMYIVQALYLKIT